MSLAVPPKLHQSSSFPCKHRIPIINRPIRKTKNFSRSDNFMDLSLETYDNLLNSLVASHRDLHNTLTQVDSNLQQVKQDLKVSAQMLLLQKGLVWKLQAFQSQRTSVILKTTNATKLRQKYDAFLDTIDSLHGLIGKSKLHSIKIKEGMAPWKHHYRISTRLLDEITNDHNCDNGAPASADDDPFTDDVQTSSNAEDDKIPDLYWDHILSRPHHDHQCRFTGSEQKRRTKLHFPTCPIQHPKRPSHITSGKGNNRPMETPMIDPNGAISQEIQKLQKSLQEQTYHHIENAERVANIQRKIHMVSSQLGQCNALERLQVKLNKLINEGARIQKNVVRIKTRLNKYRKEKVLPKLHVPLWPLVKILSLPPLLGLLLKTLSQSM